MHRIVFIEITKFEREIENDKQVIARRPDFNLDASFSLFAATSMEKINYETLQAGLQLLECACTKDEAKLLIKRYDSDGDGKLSFWEFANIFLPINLELRQLLETKKPSSDLGESTNFVKKLMTR